MTNSGSSNGLGGGASSPHLTQGQIMSILCRSQNKNMNEVSNFAETQISFTDVQTKAGQASEAAVEDNIKQAKRLANLSTILGVVSAIASALGGVGSSMTGIGASTDAIMSSLSTVSNALGNGVAPVVEGSLAIAQGQVSEKMGDNTADASVSGNLMKGFDSIAKDNGATISQTIQTSAQMTSKEQSIINEDRQSKMYN